MHLEGLEGERQAPPCRLQSHPTNTPPHSPTHTHSHRHTPHTQTLPHTRSLPKRHRFPRKTQRKGPHSTLDRWAGKILAGTVGLDIRSGVPGNWNAAQKFKPLSDDAALAWCRYLGLRRGDKNEKLEVLGQWFEQRPALGKIYRVTPERGCPCTDCVPTAEGVTQDMQDSLFSKKVGGDHELVRPPHRT